VNEKIYYNDKADRKYSAVTSRNASVGKNMSSNKNDNDMKNLKEFFSKQKIIMDELLSLKKDIQFIFDNNETLQKAKKKKEE